MLRWAKQNWSPFDMVEVCLFRRKQLEAYCYLSYINYKEKDQASKGA